MRRSFHFVAVTLCVSTVLAKLAFWPFESTFATSIYLWVGAGS